MNTSAGLPTDSLAAALAALEVRTPIERIELGLDRVRDVLGRLAPDLSGSRIISVAGTNGKGSVVAMLDAIGRAAGRRCLSYTSPHLVDFRERFMIDGQPAAAADILDALLAVEHARGETVLTWFEHVTLAGIELAARFQPDWLIAEVGLGGRLDAVNVLDPDVAVITSIGLDHQAWLGRTRAAIAREKCGIARAGRPAVVGERRRPAGMVETLEAIGAQVHMIGEQFDAYRRAGRLWVRVGEKRFRLDAPRLPGAHQRINTATAVAAALELEPGLDPPTLRDGLDRVWMRGRLEQVAPDVLVDVAHNPAAARALRAALRARPEVRVAVFSALSDKDVEGIARVLAGRFERWFVAGLAAPRGLDAAAVAERLERAGTGSPVQALESVPEALKAARRVLRPGQVALVFGSFLTAAEAIRALAR